jgi:hypothetical protein
MQQNHHSIFIQAPPAMVFPHIAIWGESTWWPPKSNMRVQRIKGEEVKEGTFLRYEISPPWGPAWEVEVAEIKDNQFIRRTFLNGMFRGWERISVRPENDGSLVEFLMEYEIPKKIDRFFWRIIAEKLHDKNIELTLRTLKKFLENPAKDLK